MPRSGTLSIKDSVAIVTGAAGGIGGAIAINLARRGCHLALADRNAEALAQTAQSARASGVSVSEHVFDIADAAAIAAFPDTVVAQHGRTNILINCAGVALGGTFAQVSLEEFAWLIEINFWSVIRMTKAFLPLLEQAHESQIVNISSLFGLIGAPGQSAYCASKFAVRGFSEALRHELELAGKNIGVTVVHPGGVRTGIAKNARLAAAMPQTDIDRMAGTWEKLLRDSPESVAEVIVAGMERREKRILCGAEASRLDIIQRLMPVGYWEFMRKKIQPRGK